MSTRLDPEDQGELERERDFLLKSLDDLETERAAGNIDDASYAELHDDYTARAAAPSARSATASTPGPSRRRCRGDDGAW